MRPRHSAFCAAKSQNPVVAILIAACMAINPVSASASQQESQSPEIAVARGGVAVINAPEGALSATMDGRNLRLVQGKLYIGVPYYSKPGSLLEVEVVLANGSSTSIVLRIKDKKFRESHITVASKYVAPDPEAQKRIAAEQKLLDATRTRFSPVLDTRTTFALPAHGVASSPFGVRRFVNKRERSAHRGHDIAAPTGTPVFTPLGGRVALTANLYYTGNTVVIDHGMGMTTLYAHLDSIAVQLGDILLRGMHIGEVGSTGRSTGPHLHWGMTLNGELVDPLYLLEE